MAKTSPHQRAEHLRRYRQAAAQMEAAAEWCADTLVILTIKNDGQHWSFVKGDQLVEWWPSTSKCVVNKRWKSAKQVNSWKRLVPVLESTLRKQVPVVKAFAISAMVHEELDDNALDDWSEKAFDWDAEACPFEVGAG